MLRCGEIKPSGIRRFFDIANEIPGVISLGVGEPDFDTPWIVRDEGMYTLQKGRTFYTANAGLAELHQEICLYLERRYNLHYSPEDETVVTVGGSEAIDLALRAMLDPGDEVVYARRFAMFPIFRASYWLTGFPSLSRCRRRTNPV